MSIINVLYDINAFKQTIQNIPNHCTEMHLQS